MEKENLEINESLEKAEKIEEIKVDVNTEYIKIYEAKDITQVKEALEDLELETKKELLFPEGTNQTIRESNTIRLLNKGYAFVNYKDVLVQIKHTDNINDFKEVYNKRKDVVNLEKASNLLNKDIRTMNRLIIRLYNFLNTDELDFKEIRLITDQIARLSLKPNFQHRLLSDLLKEFGYTYIPYNKELKDQTQEEIVDFLLGQLINLLDTETISSRKINKIFNVLSKKYE